MNVNNGNKIILINYFNVSKNINNVIIKIILLL